VAGNANFPTSLDDSTSLYDVTDGVSTLQAAQHNNMRAAIEAIEASLGVRASSVPTSLQYRLGNPTGGHTHDGASGNGPLINATTIVGLNDAMLLQARINGSAASGINRAGPLSIGRTLQLDSIRAVALRGPSGATATFDVNFGPTSVWSATQANRLTLPPGASVAAVGVPNLVTYPSGAIITVDADTVGSSAPTEDLSLVFIFRS
jgi:hypothetical protein